MLAGMRWNDEALSLFARQSTEEPCIPICPAKLAICLLALVVAARSVLGEPPAGKEDVSIRRDIEYHRSLGHGKVIMALAYTPDSKVLAAASQDGTVRLWNADASKLIHTLQTSSLEVYAIAISPNGKLLASAGSWSEIQVWDISTGKELEVLKGHNGRVPALTFSSDGKLLASGGYDKTICLWDTVNWRENLKISGSLDRVTSLSFSPDGKTVASGGTLTANWKGLRAGQADVVRLWDVSTGKLKKELGIQGTQVAFAPDGRSLMASGPVLWEEMTKEGVGLGGSSGIRWYDLELNFMLLNTTRKSLGSVFAHSPDWKWFACTEGILETKHFDGNIINSDSPDPLLVRVWEAESRRTAAGVPGRNQKSGDYDTITAFSFDDRFLAIGSFDGILIVRSLTPDEKNSLEPDARHACKPSDDLWRHLASDDAEKAYAAIWQMLRTPGQAVKLLAAHLQPASPGTVQSLQKRLEELGSRDFALRQNAQAELRQHGWSAMPLLRTALEQAPSAEARKRLSDLLKQLLKDPAPADHLRETRAVHVLARIGSSDARAVLQRLAHGAAGASITELAQLALRRSR